MEESQFLRLERLIGKDNVDILHNSSITLFGVGAVGSFALEALLRSGVGKITLVDSDVVSLTNLNRQLIALHSTIGKNKVDVARDRALDINPSLKIETYQVFASEENLPSLIKDTDLILDCIDSVDSKVALLAYAKEHNIKVVSSMGAALRTDPSKIKVSDIKKTTVCPLAKAVRTKLRRLGITEGIRVVYSDEEVNFDYIPAREDEEAEELNGRKRNVLGSMATITAIFGLNVAHEGIRLLLQD